MNQNVELKPIQDTQIANTSDNPIQSIAQMAASGVSTEVIEQMKGLVEWDDARKAKAAFNSAFSKAKQKFKKAKKSGYNTHLKSAYSLLEDYDDATREALSEHGLSWRHVVKTIDNETTSVTCILAHEQGHAEETDMQAPSYSMTNNAVNKLQSVGIVTTYLKRMTLAAMLGIVSDSEFDNDGNGGKQSEPITQEQALNIQALIEETKSNKTHLLNYLKAQCNREIKTIADIPATAYDLAVQLLESKRKKAQ